MAFEKHFGSRLVAVKAFKALQELCNAGFAFVASSLIGNADADDRPLCFIKKIVFVLKHCLQLAVSLVSRKYHAQHCRSLSSVTS